MRLPLAILTSLLFCLLSLSSKGQQSGFILAPEICTGFSYISNIYHPNPHYAPANKGYNLAFAAGGIFGYKGEKVGIIAEYKRSYFAQNMQQKSLSGRFDAQFNSYGIRALYQLGQMGRLQYFHTVQLGYLFQTPEQANYFVKSSNGDVHGDESQTNLLNNNHMISASYGITTGYKLLWAELSLRGGIGLNNFYKPLTGINSRNYFLELQLAFGLFAKTNK